jgi:heptosyltransferase III
VSQTRTGGGVLAVFPGALGDFVCFLPAIEVLRARYGNRVALLCAGPLVDLARLAGVREVHAIEGREASWLFAATPPPQADRFYGRFESIECFTGFGVPEVRRNVERWSAGRVHRFRPVERVHFAVHCLRAIGVAAETPPEVELALDPGEARPLAGLPLNRAPRLVVHPGSGGLAKRWSRIGFRAVLERWRSEVGNADVVLGPAECSEVATWTIAGVRPFVPANVLDLARWLRRADVYLGNDSGVSHLAAAVGRRGLALFGPSDDALWGPLGPCLRVCRPVPWSGLDDVPPPGAIHQVERGLRESTSRRSP